MIDPQALFDLAVAEKINAFPDVEWSSGDDLCDCTFQRIGMWANPYLAETLEVRMCCIWARLYEQFPEYVRTIPGYFNSNTGEWIKEPQDWDADHEMPKHLWYRQLARRESISVSDARAEYRERDQERPRGRESVHLYLKDGGEWELFHLDSAKSAAIVPEGESNGNC